jgi:hypothetical protein
MNPSTVLTTSARVLFTLAFVIASLVGTGGKAAAFESYIYGFAYDALTGDPVANVCVILGPVKITCITRTKADGSYRIDFPPNDLVTADQQLEFIDQTNVYLEYDSPTFKVKGATFQSAPMRKAGYPLPCGFGGNNPTTTVYLPNITRYLGGISGWQTPFIVQNIGPVSTRLEVSFYRFSDGSLIACRPIDGLAAGTSFADVPNNDLFLPADAQFSVVVRSFGSAVVSVVNEHSNLAGAPEAMSYVGTSSGAASAFLPNITRRFFGFDTPFIIQNLGTAQTTATATFVSFDGSAPTVTSIRNIDVGRSQPIDPNFEPGLIDGKQYAVTVTSAQPISVVVNTQDDLAGAQFPKAYSVDGFPTGTGGATLYGAYAAKNTDGIGRVSTIVIQNMGTSAATPSISFTPMGGGIATNFTLASIAPNGSKVFDPRYTNGDTTQPFCSATGTGCLADGEYSFTVTAAGASLAGQVNVISNATAMGYAMSATPSGTRYLPNVTRTLGGASGWTTPVVVQSGTATGATLKWYRFSDGALMNTQTLTMTPGSALRVDPRTISALADNTQYSVVATGTGGTITAIVIEQATGGDNAMIYEGFAGP